MLKAYVCPSCRGSGKIEAVEPNPKYVPATIYDENFQPEFLFVNVSCFDCVDRGLPPKVELPVNGPPAAKECIIEAEFTPFVPPALEEPK